jgi:predicted transcriptional regulator
VEHLKWSEYLELLAPLDKSNQSIIMNRRGRKKAPLQANYSIANYLKTDSKAMVTQILDTPIENAVNNSKIVATEIIDDILKGTVKTDNNSTKRKHSVTDKTFVTWKEIFPLLCKVGGGSCPAIPLK